MAFSGPLFVVGAPRSGTKLLRTLLNEHSQIGIPDYETEFLPRLLSIQDRFDTESAEGFNAFYGWATRFMYFKYMAEEGRQLSPEQWLMASPDRSIAGLFEGLCRADGGIPMGQSGVWGDKSPNYRNDLPALRALYPNARFVHIIRDVRDVTLSSQVAWGKDPVRNAQRWMDELNACRAWGASFGPQDYLELRYEDLVHKPKLWLSAICRFIGLPFQDAMLHPSRSAENLGDTKGVVGIVATNTEKWRERMTPDLLQRTEAICGPLLAELGYPLAGDPQRVQRVSPAEMQLRKLADGANLMRFRVRDWGMKDAIRYSASALESTLKQG
ncbi:MAG: hypothetical protein ACI9VR_003157 [Cognaticolwellia sp.]|jgi:hypothetical protein